MRDNLAVKKHSEQIIAFRNELIQFLQARAQQHTDLSAKHAEKSLFGMANSLSEQQTFKSFLQTILDKTQFPLGYLTLRRERYFIESNFNITDQQLHLCETGFAMLKNEIHKLIKNQIKLLVNKIAVAFSGKKSDLLVDLDAFDADYEESSFVRNSCITALSMHTTQLRDLKTPEDIQYWAKALQPLWEESNSLTVFCEAETLAQLFQKSFLNAIYLKTDFKNEIATAASNAAKSEADQACTNKLKEMTTKNELIAIRNDHSEFFDRCYHYVKKADPLFIKRKSEISVLFKRELDYACLCYADQTHNIRFWKEERAKIINPSFHKIYAELVEKEILKFEKKQDTVSQMKKTVLHLIEGCLCKDDLENVLKNLLTEDRIDEYAIPVPIRYKGTVYEVATQILNSITGDTPSIEPKIRKGFLAPISLSKNPSTNHSPKKHYP